MEEITEKLLDKILYLQENLAQKEQENKNIREELENRKDIIDYLREEKDKQEERSKIEISKLRREKDEVIRPIIIMSVGFTILVYFFIKLLLWYFF